MDKVFAFVKLWADARAEPASRAHLVEFMRKQAKLLAHKESMAIIQIELQERAWQDVKLYKLPWIFFLHGFAQHALKGDALYYFISRMNALMKEMDTETARFAAPEFVFISRQLAHCLTLAPESILAGLGTLRRTIEVFRLTPGHLTRMHADFVFLCLQAHHHHFALPVLNEFVWRFDDKASEANVEDALKYLYFGGMAYCGAGDFVVARRWFEYCMCVPANVTSAIAVAAFKKWVLTSIIVDGKCGQLPRVLPSCVGHALPHVAEAYVAISRAGAKNVKAPNAKVVELEQVAAKHSEQLMRDNNLGLMKQAIHAALQFRIRQQTRTYATMSLSQIATAVGLSNAADAEAELVKMIEKGNIVASIDASSSMVTFGDRRRPFDTMNDAHSINARFGDVVKLNSLIATLDEELTFSDANLKKLVEKQQQSGTSASTTSAGDRMALDV